MRRSLHGPGYGEQFRHLGSLLQPCLDLTDQCFLPRVNFVLRFKQSTLLVLPLRLERLLLALPFQLRRQVRRQFGLAVHTLDLGVQLLQFALQPFFQVFRPAVEFVDLALEECSVALSNLGGRGREQGVALPLQALPVLLAEDSRLDNFSADLEQLGTGFRMDRLAIPADGGEQQPVLLIPARSRSAGRVRASRIGCADRAPGQSVRGKPNT